MATIKRGGYHHGSLRDSLLSQAFALLDEAGPDAVTIRAVARRAQVSHAAPANHFADRSALLTAMATHVFQIFESDVQQMLATARQHDRARVYMEVLLNFGLDHPNRYSLMWRRDIVDWNDHALNLCMDSLYLAFVREIAILPNQINRDPDTLAIALWSMIHGYIGLRLSGVFESRSDKVSGAVRANAMLDLLFTS